MSTVRTELDQEALHWLLRVNDPAFEAWEAWDAWMATDPDHADAYWRLAEAEGDVVEALKAAPAPGVQRIMPRRAFALPRRSAIAAAVAVLAVGGAWIGWSQRAQPWIIETAPGEQRNVILADGSEVSLAGATRLALDRRRPRDVRLEAGRALFEVTHDAAHPFVVEVGDATLTDLGTTFDVTRLGDGARVAVSEGIVRVDTRNATATLNAGDAVVATPDGLESRSVSPEDVASWREGRLSYTGETLAIVAEDLSRALNRPIVVSPSLADRQFSGSLTTTTEVASQKTRLARLLGVSVVEDGEGWRLEP
ncbi:FecR family protein [Brevundimonas sp. R86498]|uniref:FecR family protein n=1 Tax=Brevundimonas sp. R86498 TaxID=3093845 RepID=UPI0037C7AFDE